MISDEAVEALQAAYYAHRGTWLFDSSARAALEAALPHLLADTRYPVTEQKQEVSPSQGCGTGHSGEQLEPAVGATAALAKKTMTLTLTDEEMAALEEIAKARDATPRTIFRSALKVFQLEARGFATINIDLGQLSATDQQAVKRYDAMVRDVNRMRDDGTIPDGGEAVHARPLSAASAAPNPTKEA